MMSTGVKENCHCWEWESPQMPPPLPGKATNHQDNWRLRGNRRGVADLGPAGAEVTGYPRIKGSPQERKTGSAHRNSPLGKIQRAEKGCIRGAWAGIPQVATS